MKKTYSLLTLLLGSIMLLGAACGNPSITFQASDSARAVALDSNVAITDFQISIREIELKPESVPQDNSKKITHTGPYTLDLLSDAGPLEQTLGEAEIEPNNYKLVRFNLHRNQSVDAGHVLYQRSVYLAGTINGTNFIMWHDVDENFDVVNSKGITVDSGDEIVVRFNLQNFLSGIDLTTAEASGGNIDINPYSSSPVNKNLAKDLKSNIKASADFYKK